MPTFKEIDPVTDASVRAALKQWADSDAAIKDDEMLVRLFQKDYPGNDDLHGILVKASTLNSIYFTHVYKIYEVACHIRECHPDEMLKAGDADAVKAIQYVRIGDHTYNFYSFATKYCSFTNQSAYPIYDGNVDAALRYFKEHHGFDQFEIKDLKDYSKFKDLIDKFKSQYSLTGFTYKEIDHYLWYVGDIILKEKK